MTTRKPLLPVISGWLNASRPYQVRDEEREAMRTELRVAEAVIRAAWDHSHAEVAYHPDPDKEARRCPICRALARLDKFTRPTQRTP